MSPRNHSGLIPLSLHGLRLTRAMLIHVRSGLASMHNPQEADRLTREVEPSADRAIDDLVYELYRLSEDEIRIVEGK